MQTVNLSVRFRWQLGSDERDVAFDTRFKLTICADARYIMWVVDKVLNGHRLLDEMSIVN
ncbi:hypothetical protein EMGBS15_16050 [Filimonas sp.]|nr:hypothetical protein EMGBS15_16050 [Filimonas sp.]